MPSPQASELYFLDTNVIVYGLGRSTNAASATQKLEAACRRTIQAIGQDTVKAVTNLVVLQELIYLLARWTKEGKGPQMPNAQRVVSNVVALCQAVFTPTMAELILALEGYDPKRHDFNDRLIVQALRAHGIVRILTADRGFERMQGVKRVDPVSLAKQLGS